MWRSLLWFSGSVAAGFGTSTFYYKPSSGLAAVQATSSASPSANLPFSPSEFRSFKLKTTLYESHDVRRFLFEFPDAGQRASFPFPSCCVLLRFTGQDGKSVVRPYTPISGNGTKGGFELLVKRYEKSNMGNHLFKMNPGESIEVKGPFEKFPLKPNAYKHIGMLAGGTGITPMFQIIRYVLENPKDNTHLSLIYANNTRKDILLASELLQLQRTFTNFDLYLTLLQGAQRWLGGIGYIDEPMIKTFMPKPGEKKTKILICGPPQMLKAISGDKVFEAGKEVQQGPLLGILQDLGYKADQVYKF